uniref:Uncharacterized protein n=1 Tax=Tetraselmis sp. GSL018 TaxID=582737 RepID=A0A061SGN5_9CHLO
MNMQKSAQQQSSQRRSKYCWNRVEQARAVQEGCPISTVGPKANPIGGSEREAPWGKAAVLVVLGIHQHTYKAVGQRPTEGGHNLSATRHSLPSRSSLSLSSSSSSSSPSPTAPPYALRSTSRISSRISL